MNGSYGADIYRYSAGAGNDVIDDDVNTDSIDELVFSGAELTQENVIVSRVGTSNDLLISFGSVEGSILLKDQIYRANTGYGKRALCSLTVKRGMKQSYGVHTLA